MLDGLNGHDVAFVVPSAAPHINQKELAFKAEWERWEKAGRNKNDVRKLRHTLVKWGERITRADQPGSSRLDDWPYEEVAEMVSYLYRAIYEDWTIDQLSDELHQHFKREHIPELA